MQDQFVIYYYSIIVFGFLLSALPINSTNQIKYFLSGVFILALSFIIGNRDLSVGSDTENYLLMYNTFGNETAGNILSSITKFASEPLFALIMKGANVIGHSFHFALSIVSLLTLTLVYHFCCRLERFIRLRPFTLFCIYLCSFSIINQQINIIRAGLATGFLLNYYLSLFENKKTSAIAYGILALSIHFSSIMCIFLALTTKLININKKYYLYFLFVIAALAYLNYGILNIGFAGVDLGKKSSYLDAISTVYQTGFRLGFTLFNIFFALVFNRYLSKNNEMEAYFFRLFIILSCLFFICYQIPYSDRIGSFSWSLIPFLTYFCFARVFKKNRKMIPVLTFFFLFIIAIGIS